MYPAREAGITSRYVRVRDLNVRVIESGPADGEVVLLVHGWAASVYTFYEMIPALVGAGFRAIAFDLPGHGLSDKPTDDARYTTASLTDVVLHVARTLGLRRFTFVGHSMGGSLGLDLATRGDPGIARLVLINSIGIGHVPVLVPVRLLSPRFINRFTPAILTRRVITGILRAAFGTRARPTQRDIDEYWATTQFREFAWACRACIHRTTWRRFPAEQLRTLRMPVLVITGKRDLIVQRGSSRARLIPGVRCKTVPRGGHLVLQECADVTNAEILDFLRETA